MPSQIAIKLLGAGDAAVLQTVAPDVFDNSLDPAATAIFLADPRHHIAVAIDEGVVVGFASAVHYVHPDKPQPELWINEVGVAETHRRQHLARRMLEALLNDARRLGCSQAWVLTHRSNEPALRLYQTSAGVEAEEDAVMFEFNL
jgi:ribosomal protein S18 acetylase RimI-like enzyme